jgi:hypothetical protein
MAAQDEAQQAPEEAQEGGGIAVDGRSETSMLHYRCRHA